jgi:hypothetical protein
LYGKNHITSLKSEIVDRDFKKVIGDVSFKQKTQKFLKDKKSRLDDFWSDVLGNNVNEYKALRLLIQMILLIFHGNAQVERGFSVNKQCVVENQNEISLVNMRRVYDAIKAADGIEKIDINIRMVQSARNAYARYKESLKTQKDSLEREKEEENKKKEKL